MTSRAMDDSVIPAHDLGSLPLARGSAGTPGGSAQREYELRRALREAKTRRRLGALGVFVARMSREPQEIAAWRQGAEGERLLAGRLHDLLDDRGVLLLHDRLSGAGRANIDHLAIGPGGVTVIDASNRSGLVRRARGGFAWRHERLHVRGRDQTRLVGRVERQITVVRRALVDADLDQVEATGALCFVQGNVRSLRRRVHVGGLLVGGPTVVAELAARDGPQTYGEIVTVLRELAVRLPPA